MFDQKKAVVSGGKNSISSSISFSRIKVFLVSAAVAAAAATKQRKEEKIGGKVKKMV